MSKNLTIERHLFDWDEWDQVGTIDIQFYGCTLTAPIGEFPIGTKFDMIVISYETSSIQLFVDVESDKYYEYELRLAVGEKIQCTV